MEVNGQLHAPADLYPGKEPSVPIRLDAGPRLYATVKRRIPAPAGNPTPVVQPVA